MITAVTSAFAFALAAAAGSVARAEAGRRWNRPGRWPGGTWAVNVSGSFLLGLLHGVDPRVSTVLAAGGLGALTTFSSSMRDAVALVERGRASLAVTYVAATVAAAVGAASLGLALSR